MTFFPRQTIEIHRLVEPKAWRRFSFSLVGMATLTGVVVRLYRSLVMTHGSTSWLYFGGTVVLETVVLLGMATAHVANYPLHQWVWRVPSFALVEVAAEIVTSAVLIAAKREANGATRAHWDDWVALATGTLVTRGITIILWGLLLAGVVEIVRSRFVHEDPDEPAEVVR